MSINNHKFLKNQWFIGIGGSIIAFIITESIGLTRILSTVWHGVTWMSNLILGFLIIKYQVSLWFLILLPIIGAGLIVLVILLITKKQEIRSSSPSFLDYTEDQFGGVLYHWEYTRDFISGRLVVDNITRYCPKCICIIINGSCPICQTSFYNKIKNHDEVIALITHHIDSNKLN